MKMVVGVLVLVSLLASFVLADLVFVSPSYNYNTTKKAQNIKTNLSTDVLDHHYSFVDFNNSLKYWYRFDDLNSTGGFVDISENNVTNYIVGSIEKRENCIFGNCTYYPGSQDYIRVPDMDNGNYANAWSLNCWFNASGWDNYLISDWTENIFVFPSSYHGWSVDVRGNPNYDIQFTIGTGKAKQTASTSAIINLNKYYHTAITFNETNSHLKIYVDGSIKSDNFFLNTMSSSNGRSFRIGSRYVQFGTTYDWNGTIDECLFFDYLLTGDEVEALYNSSSEQYYAQWNYTDDIYYYTGHSVNTTAYLDNTSTIYMKINSTDSCIVPLNYSDWILEDKCTINNRYYKTRDLLVNSDSYFLNLRNSSLITTRKLYSTFGLWSFFGDNLSIFHGG